MIMRQDCRSQGSAARGAKFAAAMAVLGVGLVATAAEAAPVGQLDCAVSGGIGFIITSAHALNCEFRPASGAKPQHYVGTIRRFGLDFGFQGPGHLVWTVVAAGLPGPGALAGDYIGGGASATVGVGLGANALIGGNGGAFSLQPLSISTQTGVDIAAGVGELDLEKAP